MSPIKNTGRLLAHSILASALLLPTLLHAADKITLRYAVWDRNQLPAEQEIAKRFEQANPDIKIEIELTPSAQYFVKLDSAAAGGVAPDIFWINMPYFVQYAKNGIMEPLAPYIKDSGLQLDDVVASSVKAYQYDGQQMAIPRDVDSIAVWYNKKLFDQAGVSYPTSDWSWDDLKNKATALKSGLKGAAFPLVMDLSIDGQDSYMNLLFQNGNHIVPKDGQPTDIANDKSIWVYQQLQGMMKDGLMPSAQQMSEVKTENIFQSNRAAMVYAGSWLAAPFANNPLINDHIGVVMMPKIERQSGVAHSLAFAMSAKSAHKQAAWKYIAFMSSEASQAELAKVVIPANKTAAKVWAQQIQKVDVSPYIQTLEVTQAYPTAGTNTPKWQNMWIASLKKIFMGADAKQEMDKSVKKIARVMEQ
ncbi:sugar ABC transporter substrate-binding protein [Serratia marcescens]|jgi:ABC-type sugar transport system, periplasmic component|uniref:sn-glycerol-3-phosphate-binding periplasmic protein UgpB n=1 Tax=Serratia marcescens TaxID=615 RepID=A0ABD5IPY8_SERMA|nr:MULTISPECIES: sugar ABC transporter substrate-binding protein [Serratia]MBL0874879.1 sugar ABC transporter substrate-binding protein [Serratia nevei]RNW07748.1 sugar ABC transporter substrate-binding protein [Serratia nematodiphila]ELQ9307224.1 sugar ABC transporter substrate-binding protein [Serratia marcescens]ELQ9437357.1 sugar ABC transporter substrate-binding protein [Serratia marcescens]ELT5558672.1 sugar ABC transporter substrate-binding protein [Serratia marcescens]